MNCKGGCGQDAKYKNWCVEKWNQCPGYKKRMSKILKKQTEELQESLPYKLKNYPARKDILWKEQNKKCNKCDYNLYDQHTGPYQIHHIDGNMKNYSRDNEELLCCNCHYMTDNYGFKGRKHSNKSKVIIGEKKKGTKYKNLYKKAGVG